MERVVIIMPTYNERDNIGWMIDDLLGNEFVKIDKAEMHLLVVDANSPDGTSEVVKEKMKKYKNLHLLSKQKEGLGADYIAGFKFAVENLKADAVVEMDADGQHPPRFVKPMVEAYLNGADYVIGSRYVKGGSIPKEWEFFRKFISYAGNLFIRIVLFQPSIHDLTTGFRLTKVKGVLDQIDLDNLMEKRRFAYKVDLLYQSIKRAKKVIEIPLEFASRRKEKSKFNPAEMISTFKVAIILAVRDKQRFIKFAVVGFTGYLINATVLEVFYRLGFTPAISAAIGAEFAIMSNFTLNNFWTFKEKKITGIKNVILKFGQFNLTSIGAIILQAAVVGGLSRFFGEQLRQFYLIVAILFFVIPYNYTVYNIFIWRTWKFPKIFKFIFTR